MKIVASKNGKETIVLSQSEWQMIGQKAGWTKKADAQISHDPFGRFSIMRRKAPEGAQCKWCGQKAKYEYGTERDDRGRTDWDGKYFCSLGCRKSYFN